MLPICVRTERVWPKMSSIQGIRANLVYIVSLGQFEAYELVSEHGGETYEIVIFQTPNLDLKTLKDSSDNT